MQLAAALAYLFAKQGDGAELVYHGFAVRSFFRSGSRPSQVRQILEAFYQAEAGADTDLGGVLLEVAERIPRRGLVIVVSDFFDDPEKISAALHHFDYRQHWFSFISWPKKSSLSLSLFESSSFVRYSRGGNPDPDSSRALTSSQAGSLWHAPPLGDDPHGCQSG